MADQLIEGTTADYIKEVDESKWTQGACPPAWPTTESYTEEYTGEYE